MCLVRKAKTPPKMEKTMKTKKILSCVGKSLPWLLALTMLLTFAAIPASADDGSVTICVPTTTVTADAFVQSNQLNVNFGASPSAFAPYLIVTNKTGQYQYTFLKFDLSGIPAGSNITAAQLKLYMEQAPTYVSGPNAGNTVQQTYNVYESSDTLSGPDAGTAWDDSNIKWSNMPTVQTTSLASATTAGLTGTPPAVQPALLTWSSTDLLNLVKQEFNGDKVVSFEVRNSVDNPANANNVTQAIFTSKESTTTNPKPCLEVTYEPGSGPGACEVDGEPLLIDAFFQTAPGTVCLNEPVCFDIEFDITACEALDNVKIQGGIGSNLTIKDLVGKINGNPGNTTPSTSTPGHSSNTLITWLIPHMDADDVATITVTVCTGLNPQGKQEFTSCGVNPITGNWSASAYLAGTKTKVKSDPEYTARLGVDVVDCAAPTSTP
jgi:hypothetical protein